MAILLATTHQAHGVITDFDVSLGTVPFGGISASFDPDSPNELEVGKFYDSLGTMFKTV